MMMESLLLPGCPGAAVTTSDGLRDPRLLPAGDDDEAAAATSSSFLIASWGIFIMVVV